MKRNYWICERDYFGGWAFEFPKFDSLEQIVNLTNYMERFLLIGKEENVFNVGTSNHLHAIGVPNLPYIEQVRWLIEHKQILEFFTYLYIRDAEVTGLISYYGKQGEIVDAEVGNMWEFLKQIHPKKYDNVRPARISPVVIAGVGNIPTNKAEGLERGIGTHIYLNTDIWFPRLQRRINGRKGDFWTKLDNRELAYRHTPRLNKFLMRVRELTLQWGGHWRVMATSDGLQEDEYYEAQLTEMGIRIP